MVLVTVWAPRAIDTTLCAWVMMMALAHREGVEIQRWKNGP